MRRLLGVVGVAVLGLGLGVGLGVAGGNGETESAYGVFVGDTDGTYCYIGLWSPIGGWDAWNTNCYIQE